MRRSLVLLVAAGAAAVALPAAPAIADPGGDPPCEFHVHEPDVEVDPDGPYYVTITPRYPHYTC